MQGDWKRELRGRLIKGVEAGLRHGIGMGYDMMNE